MALLSCIPDFDADEAIWDWARDGLMRNTCLATKAKVCEKVGAFFRGLGERTATGPAPTRLG